MGDEPPPEGDGEVSAYVGPGGKDTRTILYPLYLNKKKSVKKGRLVPSDIAVQNPTAQEILDVCGRLGLRAAMEVRPSRGAQPHSARAHPADAVLLRCCLLRLRLAQPYKMHPRDWGTFGRVRVELLDPLTKEPLHAEVHTRKQLLREVARQIPKLESRVHPPKQTGLTIQQQLGLEPIPAHLLAELQAAHMGLEQPQMAVSSQRSGKKGRKKG